MKRNINKTFLAASCLLAVSFVSTAQAEEEIISISAVSKEGIGKQIGDIILADTQYGLLITPHLRHLSPGLHGMHIHEKPSCDPAMKNGVMVAAMSAGPHLDSKHAAKHEGPYGSGHMGDLPPLFVNAEGTATLPLLAPRLKLSDLKDRSLVIHEGGDNYSDSPIELGGGGARIACGVIQR